MTIVSPNTLNTTLFQDGQAAASITASDVRTLADSAFGLTPVTKSASWTSALTERGCAYESTGATAVNWTIPPESSVAFDIGVVMLTTQIGAGQVTIVAGAGVTLRGPAAPFKTRVSGSTIGVRKRASNDWVMWGDHE